MRRPILLLALVMLAVLGALALTPQLSAPPPLRETSSGFDAARAKARLAVLLGDQQPHPTDTPANDAVRERLVAALRGMGLSPIVRDQFACNSLFKQRGVSCARVRNVIATIGPATGKAVLINAHYDSTPAGPGAGDDGVGVATMLEVAAILKRQCLSPFVSSEVETRPSTSLGTNENSCSLKRPVMLLFNEGEELGLLGARAFLSDPLSRNVDALINLEARGVTGPVNMFETSRPNGAPIAAFAAASERPVANSLSTDVYRLMPNYTDVNSFEERGWLTLNLAPIGNETRYHSPGDDIAALDPATLQHMGDQTLALALRLANDRPAAGAERIFADIAGRGLMVLPLMLGIVLLALAIVGLGTIAVRRGRTLSGVGITLGTMIGSSALAWAAMALIGLFRQGMFWRASPEWTLLAAYAGAMLVGSVLLATLGRRADRSQLRASFWAAVAMLGALIGFAAPGGIVFFIVPPLLVLAGMVAARWWKPAETVAALLAILFLYLSWGGMLGLLQELLNNGPMWIFAPLGTLLILPVLIETRALVGRIDVRAAALVGGVLTLAGWIAAAAAPAYSADRQQRFAVQHVTNADAGKGWWSLVNDGAPVPDAYRAAGTWSRGKLPIGLRDRWLASSAPLKEPAPRLEILSATDHGRERTVTARLSSNGWQRTMLIAPKNAQIRAAGTPGFVRPIDPSATGPYVVDCFGRACDGATLTLVIGKREPVKLTIVGSRAGLPASAAPLTAARPRFARPQYGRDETLAFAVRNL